MPQIYPVIHHRNWHLTESEAHTILNTPGVNGIFLISHEGKKSTDWQLMMLAQEIKQAFPNHQVGVNLLSIAYVAPIIAQAGKTGLDMLWFDKVRDPTKVAAMPRPPSMAIFSGVAFKHQPQEADPIAAAEALRQAGFIPTTSGESTGVPPSVEKICSLSQEGTRPLAIASGMTPGNVAIYAPYLSHILVATGISRNAYEVDETKLRDFIAAAS